MQVTIYEDPVTETKVEGQANLLKKLISDHDCVPPMEYWKVRFTDEPETRTRWIKLPMKES